MASLTSLFFRPATDPAKRSGRREEGWAGPHRPYDGSDLLPAPGLVWALAIDGAGIATPWPLDKPLDLLAGGEGWVWAHFNLADMRSHAWLRALDGIPEDAREVMVTADDHTQLHLEEGCLFGVLADLVRNLSGPTDEIGRLHLAMTGRFVVTARRHPLHASDSARSALAGGLEAPSPGALLETLIDRVADGFDAFTERLGQGLDRIEDHVLTGTSGDERHGLGRMRHAAVRLHRELVGLRAVLHRLERRRPESWPERLRLDVAPLAQRLDGLDHEVMALQARARLLQEEIASQLASETNRHLYVLSILTALFMPATLVTGLFGMNVKAIPFAEGEVGFWPALVLALCASGAVYLVLKRLGVMR